MNLLANVRIAIGALQVNALRSALTMLGIIIGVGAVIVMVAVGAGAQARIAEQIESLGSNLILAVSGTVTSGGARLGQGTQFSLTEEDAGAIAREVASVQAAAPSSRGTVQVVYGNFNWGTVLQGVTPEFFEARDRGVVAGRPLAQEDVDGAAKVALLGQTVAAKLFGDSDPIGQLIRVQKVPFQVIGILEGKGQSAWGLDQDDILFTPLSTAKRRVLGVTQANAHSVGAISIKIRTGQDMKQAEQEIRDLLRQHHRLQPDQDDDFSLRNLSEILRAREDSSRALTVLLAAVASVSLLVGGVGIMNIMLVSVTERAPEIGLRMAVGARGRDVLTQFLVEAVTLSSTGGCVGVAAGLVASYAIEHFAQWRTVVEPETAVLAFSVSVAVGVFFGLYPARRAARLDPIEALRYE